MVVFTADVNAATAAKLRDAIAKAANAGDDLYLLISSGGGNVFEGMSLAQMMKSLPIKITTHNIGQTDSIANVIFAAGSTRYAAANASFLFHGVSWHFEKCDLIESQLEENYQSITRLRGAISAAFATYTGLKPGDADTLMISGATILNATEALTKAIIHEVKDASIPRGAQITAIGNG